MFIFLIIHAAVREAGDGLPGSAGDASVLCGQIGGRILGMRRRRLIHYGLCGASQEDDPRGARMRDLPIGLAFARPPDLVL